MDFTSRNLLCGAGIVSVIDFETSRYEAAGRNFLRFTMRTLHSRPDLRNAFYTGYGRPPTHTEQN
ncbi:hypothetical protein [Nonomuraea insulae]|uniref:Aminoglycoside phosphotransferase domain-containing protein n=1 Tax=Nonomuraea insulae TaxID=1616787 RepID=A0ABW1CEG6_9ACTN